MLAELAGTAPVLLVLEDMHWADRSTRDLLTFLSRVLHRERVAVIATYRTDDLHRGHPLRAVAAELLRLPSVTAVEVGPLRDEAMAEHLAALAQYPLEAAALEVIIRRAEGNTYYAEELLAASACGSDLPGRPGRTAARQAAAALPGGPAGGARRGRGGPACRGRPGPAGLRPGGAGVRAGGQGSRREPVAGARRRGGLRLPARAAARGRLRRPVAGRTDPAARAAGRTALRRGPAVLRARDRGRAGPSQPGQPRHPRRLQRVGAGRPGGGPAGRARGGTPALRPGTGPVGAGHRPGEAGGHAARLAGVRVGDQRRGQR